MNWFEKIRDNFIPIERLYNKSFYTDKVASLLTKIPLKQVNQETALVIFLSKGFSKYRLLKLFAKQSKLILSINKALEKYKVYDPNSRKYVQLIQIQYGIGIEYLLLGEILEREYGFKFDYSAEEIIEDKGQAFCNKVELVLNRIGDYFIDNKKTTLKNIHRFIKEVRLEEKVAKED